jgi:hypothetical protein
MAISSRNGILKIKTKSLFTGSRGVNLQNINSIHPETADDKYSPPIRKDK